MIRDVELFWSKGRRTESGCLEWPGCLDKKGYSRTSVINDGKVEFWLRHRLAWVLTHGPIPKGIFVLHNCDNPACFEPTHLYLGTQKDNMRDMVKRGRNRGPWDRRLEIIHGR